MSARFLFMFALTAPIYSPLTVAQTTPSTAEPAVESLSLARAEALLTEHSPQLRAAEFAVESARADSITAGEAPNPQLSFNSSQLNYHDGVGSGAPWDKQVDSVIRIDQTFERGGKRSLRQKAANAAESAAQAEAADAARTARLNLAIGYYDLKFAQEAERIAKALVDLQSQSLTAARLRLKTGDLATVDVARLEIEVARANAELTTAHINTRDAQLSLAQIIGLDARSHYSADDEWPTLSTPSSSSELDARPDVQAASAHDRQAQASLDLQRAQRTRDITIGVQYERFPQPPIVSNTIGFGFSLPLFLRHRYQGEIARANADRRIAAETLRATRLAATTDRERASAELSGAAERVRQYQTGVVEQAKTTAQAAEYAYAHGALDLTDLLDARRAMQAVSLDALAAQAAYAKALAAWRAANADMTSNSLR